MNIFEQLKSLVGADLELVNKKIIAASSNEVDLIPTLANHLIAAGGKRLRPVLTLIAANMCGYTDNKHITLAAAVEFMHTATLLHDDVVDSSDKRRGLDTANNLWGNKASVLVGDYLLGKAFEMMVESESIPVLGILANAAATISQGEVLQLQTTGQLDTTIEQYLKVIEGKTAALFACACEVGGQICDNKSAEAKALRDYGLNFGMAFQIIDDALDYKANPSDTGKNLGDDLQEGKITLLVIYAYADSNQAERQFWQRVIEDENYKPNDNDLQQAIQIITDKSAIGKSIEFANEYIKAAQRALDIFDNSKQKEALLGLLDFCVQRGH